MNSQEQIEREVRHNFWIEKYQRTKDVTYRNKLWRESKYLCYRVMDNYCSYESQGDENFTEYEESMIDAFEYALDHYDPKRKKWFTLLGVCVRSRVLNKKILLARRFKKTHLEIKESDMMDTIDDWILLRDPLDYAEKVIRECDTRDFVSCLDDREKRIIQYILQGCAMQEIARLEHKNYFDIKRICARVGELYKEYMSG